MQCWENGYKNSMLDKTDHEMIVKEIYLIQSKFNFFINCKYISLCL